MTAVLFLSTSCACWDTCAENLQFLLSFLDFLYCLEFWGLCWLSRNTNNRLHTRWLLYKGISKFPLTYKREELISILSQEWKAWKMQRGAFFYAAACKQSREVLVCGTGLLSRNRTGRWQVIHMSFCCFIMLWKKSRVNVLSYLFHSFAGSC